MHKTIYLLFLFFLTNSSLWCQNSETDKKTFFDDVRFGGGVNIGLGDSHSSFSISPSAIYDFTPEFSGGLSFTYMYLKNKSTIESTTNLYGGSILALYKPVSFLQFSTEYEQLKLKKKFTTEENNSTWQSAFYIGIEYVTGNLSMGLRYDVLFDENENLLYSSGLSPIFRVYF
ncbi:hypothetical protein [Lutibacter sp. B1]|uniref:hypothetical protein n=1 Tax=Lutibacter sp. B1 TaxID=2725996 RepID=UPI00145648B0|nr:hypothetical protein [Lutibacter sp. B1]NLP57701.1 hypothetical protein [Lutibacter sp. B1]